MVLLVKSWGRNVLYHNAPDGGWAWAVLLSGFFVMAIGFSTARSLGIFYNDFMAEYEITNSQTSWIASLATSMLGLAAPIGGILMRQFDARKVIMTSGILCCLGMLISAFSTHVWMVYMGIGVMWGKKSNIHVVVVTFCADVCIAGIGFSWSYVATVAQVNMYFKKWRGIANGLMVSGSAAGGMAIPILSQYLITAYGWRGTMFVLAGVGLNMCVCGALVRPIRVITATQMAKYRELQYADKPTNIDDIQAMTVSLEVLDYIHQAEQQVSIEPQTNSERMGKFFSDYWLLFVYGLVQFTLGVFIFIPLIYINSHAKDLGCTDEQAAFILSMTALGDLVIRPFSGVIISLLKILEKRILYCLIAVCVAQASLCSLSALADGYEMLLSYAVLYGCLYGSIVTLNTTALPVLLGTENLEKYLGPLFFLSGIGSLLSPPVSGYLVDLYHSYRVAYWYTMAGYIVLSLLFTTLAVGVSKLGALLPQDRFKTKGNESRKS